MFARSAFLYSHLLGRPLHGVLAQATLLGLGQQCLGLGGAVGEAVGEPAGGLGGLGRGPFGAAVVAGQVHHLVHV